MLLSAQTIRKICTEFRSLNLENPLIFPFCERTQHKGYSFGLSSCGYDIRIKERIYVSPGIMSLASSVELFHIPRNVLMRIVDKSTWARLGIAVQNTVAEPGWCGYLTLEITNHTEDAMYIDAGMPIAQVLFETLDEPSEQPYEGKYQNQPSHPVDAIR